MPRLLLLLSIGCALVAVPQALHGQDAKKLKNQLEALQKENEQLKKENEQLKKEIDLLKTEIGSKAAGKKAEARAGLPTTTHNGVEFEVVSSKVVGTNWHLTLAALNEAGKKNIDVNSARSILEDGTVVKSNIRMGATALPVGQKVQIKLDMGQLPSAVTKFATVELNDRYSIKGGPLVLKNVRVDR